MEASTLLRLAGALALICGVPFALRLAIAAAGRARFGLARRRGLLRPVDSLALGPGAVLHVVDAGHRRFLLGSAHAGLTLLGELAPGEGALGAAEGIDPCGAKLASDVGRENERNRSTRNTRSGR